MTRTLETIQSTVSKPQRVPDPVKELHTWADSGVFQYLLAYADDGVIWGEVKDKKLVLSSQFFPAISPQLRAETLREARLFGENAEWLLWNSGNGWQARQITDGQGAAGDTISEALILWGANSDGEAQGPFYPVREADMGIRHAPPCRLEGRHSLHLKVRHYLDYDEAGVAFIKLSRLVDLTHGGAK